jgi:hypothetical protein
MVETPDRDGLRVAPGRWLVEMRHADPGTVHWLRIEGAGGAWRVPLVAPPGTTWFALSVSAGGLVLGVEGAPPGLRLRALPWWARYRCPVLLRDRVLEAMAVAVDGAVLVPRAHRPASGGRKARRRWRRSLRVMHDLALLGSAPAADPAGPVPAVAAPPPLRVGAHLHLFYPDLWPEFAALLARLPPGSALHVTGPPLPPAVAGAITAAFPGARLYAVDNVGHDIWPFVSLLGAGAFDGLDCVLKLHGKKSLHPGTLPCVGELWRRAALADLAGTPSRVAGALARFTADPELGLLGAARLRVPNGRYGEAAAWGTNRSATLALAARLGMEPQAVRLDFFAGTMFWVRPTALGALRALALGAADFAAGPQGGDGGLDHALERLLPTLVRAAGFGVEGLPPAVMPVVG